MTTFAHVETGFAMDVVADKSSSAYTARFFKPQQVDESDADFAARFAQSPISKWVIIEEPDGTAPSGATATPDGNGGYTIKNPVIVVPTPSPVVNTTKQQILDQITVLQQLAAQLS